jgi:hypothetical protein
MDEHRLYKFSILACLPKAVPPYLGIDAKWSDDLTSKGYPQSLIVTIEDLVSPPIAYVIDINIGWLLHLSGEDKLAVYTQDLLTPFVKLYWGNEVTKIEGVYDIEEHSAEYIVETVRPKAVDYLKNIFNSPEIKIEPPFFSYTGPILNNFSVEEGKGTEFDF